MRDERVKELLKRFGQRMSKTPFTAEGVPGDEERTLTKDVWAALSAEEKTKILKNTADMVAEERGVKADRIPDQTPYAMRLTHRYLEMKQEQG